MISNSTKYSRFFHQDFWIVIKFVAFFALEFLSRDKPKILSVFSARIKWIFFHPTVRKKIYGLLFVRIIFKCLILPFKSCKMLKSWYVESPCGHFLKVQLYGNSCDYFLAKKVNVWNCAAITWKVDYLRLSNFFSDSEKSLGGMKIRSIVSKSFSCPPIIWKFELYQQNSWSFYGNLISKISCSYFIKAWLQGQRCVAQK